MPFNKEEFKKAILSNIKEQTGKDICDANMSEIHRALSSAVIASVSDAWTKTNDQLKKPDVKNVFYFSAEFLMGRALGNNLMNFGVMEAVREVMEELKIDLNLVEDCEADAGLGNGGLGRLAACFLDSMASMKLPGHGYGIRYKYGMFEQKIENGYQVEYPDNWLELFDPWEFRRESNTVYVKFGGHVDNVIEKSGRVGFRRNNAETVMAIPYDMPIIGFQNDHINTLRLWQAQAIQPFDLNAFNDGDYEQSVRAQNAAENISRVLYPNDHSLSGKELRLRQQYFFTSASLQDIVNQHEYNYGENSIKDLHHKVAIQLNDTHPVVAIPELMRILMDWKQMDWDTAWYITTNIFSYTNHTVLAEALESWDIGMFRNLLPRTYQIIEEINKRFLEEMRVKNPEKVHVLSILNNGKIHMAHLAIIGSHKVNGVAALHTEILKKDVLKDWYEIYPEKFLNKTNGITPRRWIVKSNPLLTELIDSKIGHSWKTNLEELKQLLQFEKDQDFLNRLMDIKQKNKDHLAEYIKKWTGIEVDTNSIFDVQIKRLHEYKRQHLNALHIIYLYQKLKENPNADIHPRTFIFGAKAAAGYWIAKSIIKLINNIAEEINDDPVISKKLKVIFIPNYRVSVAEKIFPGSDVSEQISTAGKEGSGTGNMKFMANGAITIGTLDGANVEIQEEAGVENCVIFGANADEIAELNKNKSYHALEYYNNDKDLKKALDSLIDGTFTNGEDPELFRDLFNSLVYGTEGNQADVYYVLKDFRSYVEAQKKIDQLYRNKEKWASMMLHNIAKCGKFSSDRTIAEYAKEIWNIKPYAELASLSRTCEIQTSFNKIT